ncbi:MAG: hypothetical protein J0I81_08955 [Hyphomicrobium sp.]|nr:hypothetical protein [Hyphomicrobium sp.]
MAHLPAKIAFAVAALLVAVLASPLRADPSSSYSGGQKFEYGPYGSENNPSSNQAAPQNEPPPPVYRGGDAPRPASNEQPSDARDYRGDASTSSGAGASGTDPDDGEDEAADGPPSDAYRPPPGNGQEPGPRDAAVSPPAGDFEGGLSRVEVRASAPDSSVPYEIREHDARHAAIIAWRRKVADRFGPEFAHWRTAAAKRVDCMPDRREGLVCIASALPVRGLARSERWRRD